MLGLKSRPSIKQRRRPINKSGPKIDPCGTPVVITFSLDLIFGMSTLFSVL